MPVCYLNPLASCLPMTSPALTQAPATSAPAPKAEVGIGTYCGRGEWLFVNPIYPVGSTHDASPDPHAHSFFQCFLFRQGQGSHIISGRNHEVKPWSVHVVGKHIQHLVRHNNLATGYHIGIDLERYDDGSTLHSFSFQLLHLAALFPVLQLSPQQFEAIDKRIRLLVEELSKQPDDFTQALVRMQVAGLLAELDRYFRAEAGAWPHKYQDMANRFLHFNQLLEQNYARERSVQFYADAMGLSSRALHELTTRFANTSVLDYISHRCYGEACRLLASSPLSIKQIAFELGFNNDSYFNRFFKKYAGISAKGWRNLHKA